MSSPPVSAPPALEVTGLSHSFGRRKALDDVGFTIPQGRFTVLLGQNGAGKTTLFNLVTRLYSNRSGSIEIMGVDLRARPTVALAKLGVVFQLRTVDLDLSVKQNLLYHAGLHGLSRVQAQARIQAELDRLSLAERANDKVRQLSGGQVRRVEIARALLHKPRLLLLDEPTVGLDIGSRQTIVDHVRQLCATDGLGVLWATHLIDEVRADDAVILLHQGRVLAAGDGATLCAKAEVKDLGQAFTKLTEARAA